MYFADLQTFIAQLEREADLLRVKTDVEPYLEAAALIDRVCKGVGGGKALLFEQITSSKLPLAANLFGSHRRVALALGSTDVEVIATRLRAELSSYPELDSEQALLAIVGTNAQRRVLVKHAPCFATNASELGLDALPALHSWPGDGGRYLTLGQVFTRHPESGQQNCGMYRLQILDGETALLRCHPGSGGGAHLQAWHEQGKVMPIAIVFGGPPALTFCAGLSLPGEASEIDFVHYLTGHYVPMAECQYSGLTFPADAEVVIEGEILPRENLDEGPFGNHTGYYTPRAPAPVVHIRSVRIREGAVYPCTVVGPPPMENIYLAQAAVRLLLPLLQHDCPWVVDLHLPAEGVYHRAALVSVNAPESSAAELAEVLWQSRLLHNALLLVLLDKECALHDYANIYWQSLNAGPWKTSVFLDGDRMVVDARLSSTKSRVGSGEKTLRNIAKRWPEYGLGDM